jgi:transposase-like protein
LTDFKSKLQNGVSLSSYNVLDVAGFHHVRINHSKRFSENKRHINGIENFWNQPAFHLIEPGRIGACSECGNRAL